jgi:hypothetical protein
MGSWRSEREAARAATRTRICGVVSRRRRSSSRSASPLKPTAAPYWIEAHWGGKPCCAHCESARVGEERGGTLFECAGCGRQTTLTSGTLLEKTKKPFKVWFRAIFEISSRRNGISAKDLQRIMGFGSYKTAWSCLHKLRGPLVRSDGSAPLGPIVEMDEALVGGKGSPNKETVLVTAEAGDGGRVRLAHAANNDEQTLKAFTDREVAPDARVVTDGHAGYNAASLGARKHKAKVQTKDERRKNDAVQRVHWTVSNLKRWLLSTHGGAVKLKHLQAYLDEFVFRHNQRKTAGVGRIAARTIASLVSRGPRTLEDITRNS